MKCTKWIKNEDGSLHKFTFHRCNTCWQICENDDYMGDDNDTMCIDCFNRIYSNQLKIVAGKEMEI